MKCLRIDQIYLYLEKELPPDEIRAIEAHLASCVKCQKAVEERRILQHAANNLPKWEPPPDFTEQIMSQIFPANLSLKSILIAISTYIGFLSLSVVVYFITTAQSFSFLHVRLLNKLIYSGQNFSIFVIKLLKLAQVSVQVILHLSGYFLRVLSHLTTLLNTETYIFFTIFTLILFALAFLGVGRIFFAGEKI
ncbi:MAG: zf-HC2 domain-containing protein [Candidatus Aminicenantes bacterium]|nr:zf-HC2 domain-containing protein [Candidatus Aminicenantes bacterium]